MATRDDVYAKFGITAEAAQLLETSLGTLLLGVQSLRKGWHDLPQPVEGRALLDRIEKSTLGTLLKELQKLVTFEGDLPAFFLSALRTRNKLMHGFYERHDFKMLTDAGRDAMISDLDEMHDELIHAWQMAEAMTNPVALKMDELSDYDSFDDKRLRQMRQRFEKDPMIAAGPKLAAFIERQWPSLAGKIHRIDRQEKDNQVPFSGMDLDNLTEEQLELLRLFIETLDFPEAGPKIVALVEKRWPWLLEKLQPRGPQ
jgi:hypothetical protein